MITPGNFGLFNAHRGLLAAQAGLNTVNHNLSNMNTPGFSRQRVDFEAMPAYTDPAMITPAMNRGQVGQGVIVQQITRARDAYLDGQYRLENSTLGLNEAMQNILSQVEGVLGEPSDTGLNNAIQQFFDAAQALSLTPNNSAARRQWLQQAEDLVARFQQAGNQLVSLRENLVGDASNPDSIVRSQLALSLTEVNTQLANIAQLNQQIVTVNATGAKPNDLLDKRDRLLDELSKSIGVTITPTNNDLLNITLGGQTLVQGSQLLNLLQVVPNNNTGPYDPSTNPDPLDVPALVQTITNPALGIGSNITTVNNSITSGEIGGLLRVGGNPSDQSSIYGVLQQINTLFTQITSNVNTVQLAGRTLDGNLATEAIFIEASGTSLELFRTSVNAVLQADPTLIAAAIDDPTATTGSPAGFAGVGDGRNALSQAQLRTTALAGLANVNVTTYLNTIVSGVGIDLNAVSNRADTQQALVTQLEQQRSRVSGVNQDEELIDMLRFQRAFEASSRMVRTFDQMMQTLLQMV